MPGVPPATVSVIGAGIVGVNAARVAAGLGANVFILDVNLDRLRYIDDVMPQNVTTVFSNRLNILECLRLSDLVIGAVLIPGAKAPHLVRRADLKIMQPRSVVIDVAIDQGGCFETSRPTTHANPTYIVDDIVHYCVTHAGAVGRTAPTRRPVTFPTRLQLANKGPEAVGNPRSRGREHRPVGDQPAVAETFGLGTVGGVRTPHERGGFTFLAAFSCGVNAAWRLPIRKSHVVILAAWCGCCCHGCAGAVPHGIARVIGRECARNWLFPVLREPFLTKPPGHYAAIGLCSLPCGDVTVASARLPSVLAATVAVFLVYFLFRQAIGERRALLAALLLPTSVLWLDKVPSAEIDMTLVGWVTAAIVCFHRALERNSAVFWVPPCACRSAR